MLVASVVFLLTLLFQQIHLGPTFAIQHHTSTNTYHHSNKLNTAIIMDESQAEKTCKDVAGVWKRLFEEDPIGDIDNADRDTFVYWMQVPT